MSLRGNQNDIVTVRWPVRPLPLLIVTLAAGAVLSLLYTALLTLLDASGQLSDRAPLMNALALALTVAAMVVDSALFAWALRAQRRMGLVRVELGTDWLFRMALAAAIVLDVRGLLSLGQVAEAGSGLIEAYMTAALFVGLRRALRYTLLSALLLPVFRARYGALRAIAGLTLVLTVVEYMAGIASSLLRQGLLSALLGMPMDGGGLQVALILQQGIRTFAWMLTALCLLQLCGDRLPATGMLVVALQALCERLLPGKLSLLLADLGFLPRIVREQGSYYLLYFALSAAMVATMLLRYAPATLRRRFAQTPTDIAQ